MKDVRNKMGLSLSQMADILGVQKSSFSMYENGKRKLQHDVRMKLMKLQIFLNDQEQVESLKDVAAVQTIEHQESIPYLTEIPKPVELELLKLETKQEKISELYIKQNNALRIIKIFQHDIGLEHSEPQQRRLMALAYQCEKKMRSCGLDLQISMHIDIETLKAKKNIIKDMMAKHGA